ncbi:hypothetical protein JHL17_34110 [Azospirillum sp. YIM B02556]|uniref:Uncharacterized protein n=1 Tax=Azospirillum endophyticum TaxID=2800326 RepID=A0ABS1FGA9_9PROT|nr:hypothetical protein [Azospirillum endophyticum]MBK1842442.1 hypothetical protein [Azospirillum endophyticum]
MTIITKAGLAAELGISKARVSQYCKAGLPVRTDGKLNREDALYWIRHQVNTGYHPTKGADRIEEMVVRQRHAARMQPTSQASAAPAEPGAIVRVDGLTPEAHALRDALGNDGAVILDRFLSAYGVPVVDRLKAFEAFTLTIGYLFQGLHDGRGDPWEDFTVTRPPDLMDAEVCADFDDEIDEANSAIYASENDPDSAPYTAILAGRRARVEHGC